MIRAAIVHAALLVAPALLLGRAGDVAHPRSIACVVILVGLGVLEARAVRSPDPIGLREPGSRLALTTALGVLATGWLAIGAAKSDAWLPWLGAPLAAVGIALRIAAIRALGAGFTSAIAPAPGRPLVTTGVYRRLRHPSEVGLLALSAGLAVLGASALALATAALVVAPSVLARVVWEERSLSARFGLRTRAKASNRDELTGRSEDSKYMKLI